MQIFGTNEKIALFSRLFEHLRRPKAYTVIGTLEESHFCPKCVPYYIFVTIVSNQAILASVCRTALLVAAVSPVG
jgi:hypothetical protein